MHLSPAPAPNPCCSVLGPQHCPASSCPRHCGCSAPGAPLKQAAHLAKLCYGFACEQMTRKCLQGEKQLLSHVIQSHIWTGVCRSQPSTLNHRRFPLRVGVCQGNDVRGKAKPFLEALLDFPQHTQVRECLSTNRAEPWEGACRENLQLFAGIYVL